MQHNLFLTQLSSFTCILATMQSLLLGIIVVLVVFGGGIYFFTTQEQQSVSTTQTPQNISPTASINVSQADPEAVNKLKAGGSSYTDPDNVFTILYPNDYTQDVQNNGEVTRFFKQGPTQHGQTEMYDGVIVTIEKVAVPGKSLSQWVDERIKQTTADGTSQITSPKKPITVNNFPGFAYTIRGLGEFQTLVIQKDDASQFALSITQLVADPGNIGFQKEADAILATLQLLK